MAIGDMRQDRKAESEARNERQRAEGLSRMADRPLRTPDIMPQRVRPTIPGPRPLPTPQPGGLGRGGVAPPPGMMYGPNDALIPIPNVRPLPTPQPGEFNPRVPVRIDPSTGYPVGAKIDQGRMFANEQEQSAFDAFMQQRNQMMPGVTPTPMQTALGGGIAGLTGLYGQMSGNMAPMPRTMPMQVPTQPMGKGGQMPTQMQPTFSGGKGTR